MARTREQIHEARRQLRLGYGQLFDAIAASLYRVDPIGINFGDNPDEYEPEAETILPRLKACYSAQDVQRVVHEEFIRWFGPDNAGSKERYEQVASEIWQLWQEHLASAK